MQWLNTYSQGLKYNIEIRPSYWQYVANLLYLLFAMLILQLILVVYSIEAGVWISTLVTSLVAIALFYLYITDKNQYLVLYEQGLITLGRIDNHIALIHRASRVTPLGCSLAFQVENADDTYCQITDSLDKQWSKKVSYLFIYKDSVEQASYARLCRVIRNNNR